MLPFVWALIWSPLALAQNTLEELLDAGVKRMSAEEFEEEIVQRVIVGPTMTGGNVEMMYGPNGIVSGSGSTAVHTPKSVPPTPIGGEWSVDGDGRICIRMTMPLYLSTTNYGVLPPRCQYWFKLADKYYFSDSDSDRRMRVLVRTVKQ
jgi:hypothetical protein